MTAYADTISRPVKTLTEAEQRALLKVTGQHVDGFRDHVIFSLAMGTGLREHELLALDVGDGLAPVVVALRRDAFALLRHALGRMVLRLRARHHRQMDREQQQRRNERSHVRRVSTMRRSSDRNSADCISFSREIVRGNSCASGPSV